MRISVDTSHDSHDDIRKVVKLLQHLVGDSQEVFTNNPQEASSPMANIFGDVPTPQVNSQAAQEAVEEPAQEAQQAEESTESTEDLFAELFSEEELKKMDASPQKEEEPEIKPKDKRYKIEFYDDS